MSSSAQRDLYEERFEEHPAAAMDAADSLRRIAVERLAAHRHRRGAAELGAVAVANVAAPVISEAAQRVRDAVAARYRQSPSYREFLAAQPATSPWVEETVRVAQPVLVAAAQNEEIVAAQAVVVAPAAEQPAPLVEPAWDWQTGIGAAAFEGELEVRPYADLPQPVQPPARSRIEPQAHPEELEGLEEEIEFRLAPEFVEHLIEPLPIQANIIEFPRQLVAARKARPRLAEGPLRSEEAAAAHVAAPVASESEFQMRIFEVEEPTQVPPAQALQAQAATVEEPPVAHAPEWQELVLDAPVKESAEPVIRVETVVDPSVGAQAVQVASFELRLMSTMVDAVCIAISFVAFATVAVSMGGHPAEVALRELSVLWLAAIGVAVLAALAMVYQLAFFTLGAATPGMSYAGLVFRTMAGREPSRKALRRRVAANALAAAPLGLGLAWSIVDRQGLGWNDRMSGLFLREF